MTIATPEFRNLFDEPLGQALDEKVVHLKKCLDKEVIDLSNSSVASLPEEIQELCGLAKRDLEKIRTVINDAYIVLQNPIGNNSYPFLLKKAQFAATAILLTQDYLDKYEAVLHPKLTEELNFALENFSVNYLSVKGLGLLGQSPTCKKVLDQLKKYSTGMDLLVEYVRTVLSVQPEDFLNSHEKDMFSFICETNLNYSFPSNDELKKAGISNRKRYLMSKLIEKIRLDSSTIFQAIQDSVSRLVASELDGETVYLSPDSAEGKAIKRIESIESGEEVEWITDVEEGTFSNEADLDRWLSASGYL